VSYSITNPKGNGFDPTKVGKADKQWWPFGPATAEAVTYPVLMLTSRTPSFADSYLSTYSVYMSSDESVTLERCYEINRTFMIDYLDSYVYVRFDAPRDGWYLVNSQSYSGYGGQLSLWHYKQGIGYVKEGIYTGSNESIHTPKAVEMSEGYNHLKVMTDHSWNYFEYFTIDFVNP
ncbi:hypothetical protein ACFL6S_12045, partial [Candidatus Poribacteria bacterium]